MIETHQLHYLNIGFQLLKKIINNDEFCYFGTLIYLLYPYLFGQSLFSPKDIPFMSAWIFCTYISFNVFENLIEKNNIATKSIIFLAISTAIIVTRISSNHDLSEQIGSQIGIKEAWLPSSAVLFLIGMIPGMPNFLFLIASVLSLLMWYYLYKNQFNEEAEGET